MNWEHMQKLDRMRCKFTKMALREIVKYSSGKGSKKPWVKFTRAKRRGVSSKETKSVLNNLQGPSTFKTASEWAERDQTFRTVGNPGAKIHFGKVRFPDRKGSGVCHQIAGPAVLLDHHPRHPSKHVLLQSDGPKVQDMHRGRAPRVHPGLRSR